MENNLKLLIERVIEFEEFNSKKKNLFAKCKPENDNNLMEKNLVRL
ncbi:hypothetical protein H312_01546 [Anncaliia algerae PRA339]|uniref:Uncharacterized protein n=1 Tax=Anncaliia algerae PRA339 TaxID=1288291 RepID=A0A059F1N9_9MICR|nr:hypothetical protein H312_01546 [Anncaliia algerae PRA339]